MRAFPPSGLEEGLELGLPKSSIDSLQGELGYVKGGRENPDSSEGSPCTGDVAFTQDDNETQSRIKLNMSKKQEYLAW